MRTFTFGPYFVNATADHAVIDMADSSPCNPTWYELQHIARAAFGSHATVIEIFPPSAEVYDTRDKRHLWRVPDDVAARMPTFAPGRWREEWT